MAARRYGTLGLMLMIAFGTFISCATKHQVVQTPLEPPQEAGRYDALEAAIDEVAASEPITIEDDDGVDTGSSLTPEQREWLKAEALAWLNEAKHMLATEEDHQVYLDWHEYVDASSDDGWGIERDEPSYAEAHRLLDCAIADIEADNFDDDPGFSNQLQVYHLALYAKWREDVHSDGPEEWSQQLPSLSEGEEDLWYALKGPKVTPEVSSEARSSDDWEGLTEGWNIDEEPLVEELEGAAEQDPGIDALTGVLDAFRENDRLHQEALESLDVLNDMLSGMDDIQVLADNAMRHHRGTVLYMAAANISITLIELGGVYRE